MSSCVLKAIDSCRNNFPESKSPDDFENSVNDLDTFGVCNGHMRYNILAYYIG